jgi:cytochrome P450
MAFSAERVIPAHIPPHLVYDFDLYTDPRFQEPGGVPAALARVREEAPDVFWSPKLGGYWVAQGFDAVAEAGKRADLFTSTNMTLPHSDAPSEQRIIPLNLDPPDHTPMRKPLDAAFKPTQMMLRQDRIRALATELLDKIAPLGRADFFEAVAEPLPVIIFMEIMGLDLSRFREFREYAKATITGTDPDMRTAGMRSVTMMMHGLIAERRKEPRDDLVSKFIKLEVEGRPVTDQELLGYCLLLYFAGLDTVANMIGFSVRNLAHDQELQQRVRDDPSKIPQMVEEMLRRHAVAPVARTVTTDMEWRGATMRKGDGLVICYPIHGIDEKVFPNATKIDLERPSFNHYAFGSGPHRCVGRHLARIELHVLFEELFKRIPPFRPDPERREQTRGGYVMTVDYLPLVWDVRR